MKRWRGLDVGWMALAAMVGLLGSASALADVSQPSVNAWLERMHEASRSRAYTGTFVVSADGRMASAKIWHVCNGTQQMERVESLSGTPRSTFRRNDQVVTFFPQTKVAVSERRESLGLFPNMLKARDIDIGAFYGLKGQGSERMAGFESDVVQLVPKDGLRYGYRVWSEKKTGVVVQLQTLEPDGRVVEQAAFSELQLDAPVSMDKLSKMMDNTAGYRVEHPDFQPTTPQAQGWALRKAVPGFYPMGCYKRTAGAVAGEQNRPMDSMHWMFSDGLATVSLFVEPFDARRHVREGVVDMGGATHTLTRRMNDWWLTVVGEVPPATLTSFAQELERKK